MKLTEVWKDSDGMYSWGRVASTALLGYGLWAFAHVVAATGHIPDPATLAGLMAFILGPYATNKVTGAFATNGNQL